MDSMNAIEYMQISANYQLVKSLQGTLIDLVKPHTLSTFSEDPDWYWCIVFVPFATKEKN